MNTETHFKKILISKEGNPKNINNDIVKGFDTNVGRRYFNFEKQYWDMELTSKVEWYLKEIPASNPKKSIEECKDEAAKKVGYANDPTLIEDAVNGIFNEEILSEYITRAMKLYRGQGREAEVELNSEITSVLERCKLGLSVLKGMTHKVGLSIAEQRCDELTKEINDLLKLKPFESDAIDFQVWIRDEDWQPSREKENCFDKRAGNLIHGRVLETKTIQELYELFKKKQIP